MNRWHVLTIPDGSIFVHELPDELEGEDLDRVLADDRDRWGVAAGHVDMAGHDSSISLGVPHGSIMSAAKVVMYADGTTGP